ncbi:MAG: tetratricopeptide repeat protein [Nannocystaceae bacterium]|nr:tetratricopeptide repeat protein [Nannocystaceae bacterium]
MSQARWDALADAAALGESLTADARARLEANLDPRERSLYVGIAALADDATPSDDDRRRAEQTLQRFRQSQQAAARTRTRRRVLGVGLALAAALLLWTAWPRDRVVHSSELDATVVTGGFSLAGDTLARGATVPGGEWIAARGDACLELGQGRACFDDGSELRVDGGALQLRRGAVRVEQGALSLQLGEQTVVLHAGDRHAVAASTAAVAVARETTVAPAPIVAPAVPQPAPAVALEVPDPAAVAEAPVAKRPSREPVASAPPGEMLAQARSLANAGELSRAVAAYDALRRAHPGSTEAHTADVSLGQLQLRRGRSKDALAAFDRYLHKGGGLAEEARWGRVQALHALGRAAASDRAIDELLRAHPLSVYADDAKALRSR